MAHKITTQCGWPLHNVAPLIDPVSSFMLLYEQQIGDSIRPVSALVYRFDHCRTLATEKSACFKVDKN